MQQVLAVVTVVVVGLMVGVEFAVAVFVNPIFDRLPGDGGPAARIDGAKVLGRVMPVWYLGSLALGVLWGVLAWGHPAGSAVLMASALLVVSVVMSLVLLVPINSRARRWSTEDLPRDWKAQSSRWDQWHYVRVGLIVAAFVLFVVGAV